MAICCHVKTESPRALRLPRSVRGVEFAVQVSTPFMPRCVTALCVAAMKADRKRLKVEKADIVNQMQQLYTTLESREEQLREFIRNYDQHRKVQLILCKPITVKLHVVTGAYSTKRGLTWDGFDSCLECLIACDFRE